MKKVSIIIPAYKCAEYIGKNLENLFLQTYRNIEIIVVNDGSPDNLKEVLNKYRDKIKIIDKLNGGASSARNLGLDEAEGEYITFIDSDDWIDNDAIEKAVEVMENEGVDLVKYNRIFVYPDGQKTSPLKIYDKRTVISKSEFPQKIYLKMLNGIAFNAISCMYKKSIIGKLRFDESFKTCEDAVFNAYYLTKSNSAAFIPDINYYYYQTGSGLTGSGLGVAQKYKYNFKLGKVLYKLLNEWGMNNLKYKFRIAVRPIRITFDKLTRK